MSAPATADAAPARAARARPLVVGSATDGAERDADAAADRVVRMLAAPSVAVEPSSSTTGRIRRASDRPLRGAPPGSPSPIRRELATTPPIGDEEGFVDVDDEDQESSAGNEHDDATDSPDQDEAISSDTGHGPSPDTTPATPDTVSRTIRRASSSPASREGGQLDPVTAGELDTSRGRGRPLGPTIRGPLEQAFGADLSRVSVHADAAADRISRSINASAFTVGSDVFFSAGRYRPDTDDGRHLLAHELAHVVQDRGPVRRSTVIRRKWGLHKVKSNAHLRARDQWTTHIGPRIDKSSIIMTDDQTQVQGGGTTWLPAVSVDPRTATTVPADRQGFIRAKRANGPEIAAFSAVLGAKVKQAFLDAHTGAHQELITGAKCENFDEIVSKLVQKHLRVMENAGVAADKIQGQINVLGHRLTRITEGAEFLATSIEEWRKKLLPGDHGKVVVEQLKYMSSDLHEHGLGVVRLHIKKPVGGTGPFANETDFKVMLKPEDKTFEEALLGSQADSAVNEINQILGIDGDKKRALASIRMMSDATYGSLVEFVKGKEANEIWTQGGAINVEPAFHETLVFALLAGLDDLHHENVFYNDDGVPVLIDADNALSLYQANMTMQGKNVQSGFGAQGSVFKDGAYHDTKPIAKTFHTAAAANKEAIKDPRKTVDSELLDALRSDALKRTQIKASLTKAMTGKKGRIVPVRTKKWGETLEEWLTKVGTPTLEDAFLDQISDPNFLVREGLPFDTKVGPGLISAGKPPGGVDYRLDVERAQLRKDFNAGVIPFYEYEFSTGTIYHNSQVVYVGVNAITALNNALKQWFPAW